MLKVLAGHFYTRGAIEEMLAEEFGLPAKRTLDDIFARLGQMEGIRVEVHQQNKKYYGYFGEPGEELTKWEDASEEDPGDEQPADPLGLIMESIKERVWQKAVVSSIFRTFRNHLVVVPPDVACSSTFSVPRVSLACTSAWHTLTSRQTVHLGTRRPSWFCA